MKNCFTCLIALCFSLIGYAQAPASFSYQSVFRHPDGSVIANKNVKIRVSILRGSISGASVYSESHAVTTSALGIVQLKIGTGTEKTGSMATINWSSDTYFVKIEIDPIGGSNYVLSSVSQLLSVPYALHANTAGAVDWTNVQNKAVIPTKTDQLLNTSGFLTKELDASATNELQTLRVSNTGDTLYISNGNFVIIPGISVANQRWEDYAKIDNAVPTQINQTSIAAASHLLETVNVTFLKEIDPARLGSDARKIYTSGTGSSILSHAIAMQLLQQHAKATLLKKGPDINYEMISEKADFSVRIDSKVVGVSVVRASTFPRGVDYTSLQARSLLEAKLADIERANATVGMEDRWVKQILVVFADTEQVKSTLLEAYATLSVSEKNSTIVLVVVTAGADDKLYE